MIAILSGTLVAKSPGVAIVDCSGVGFEVHIPLSTFSRLGDVESTVRLYTHLSVRENAMELFGFLSTTERELFARLIGVSGIGPRLALSVLSGMDPDGFRMAIVGGDTKSLSRIPGVGKKTAERLVMELRESFSSGDIPSGLEALTQTAAPDPAMAAVQALVSLGLGHPEAVQAVRRAEQDAGKSATTDALVKAALKRL